MRNAHNKQLSARRGYEFCTQEREVTHEVLIFYSSQGNKQKHFCKMKADNFSFYIAFGGFPLSSKKRGYDHIKSPGLFNFIQEKHHTRI